MRVAVFDIDTFNVWRMKCRELMQGSFNASDKSDVWALGITCFELCGDNVPYSEYGPMRAIRAISNGLPPLPKGKSY